jgi:hypothetical protein
MHHPTCCLAQVFSYLGDSSCGVLQSHQPEPIAVKTKRSKASRPRRRSCGFHRRGGRAIAVSRAQPAAMLSLMTALALAMYTSNASSHICSKRSKIWFPARFSFANQSCQHTHNDMQTFLCTTAFIWERQHMQQPNQQEVCSIPTEASLLYA